MARTRASHIQGELRTSTTSSDAMRESLHRSRRRARVRRSPWRTYPMRSPKGLTLGAAVGTRADMIRGALRALSAAALLLSCACGTEADDPALSIDENSGDALSLSTAEIHFISNWTITVAGDVVAGSPLRVRFDEDRLSSCRSGPEG